MKFLKNIFEKYTDVESLSAGLSPFKKPSVSKKLSTGKRFQPFKKKFFFDQKLHTGTLEGWNDLRNDPEGSGIDFIFLGGWSLVDPK